MEPQHIQDTANHGQGVLHAWGTAVTTLGAAAYGAFNKFSLKPLKFRVRKLEDEVKNVPSINTFESVFQDLKESLETRHKELREDIKDIGKRLDGHIDGSKHGSL